MTDQLEFHPLANLFPLMEGDEFDQLVEDIRANGLREMILLHEGKILDGRNRYRACLKAGVKPTAAEYLPEFSPHGRGGPLAYVLSVNLHRRHLTTQQRAAIAAELATMKVGDNQHTGDEPLSNDRPSSRRLPGHAKQRSPEALAANAAVVAKSVLSTREAAAAMKVSEPSVARAKKRMREDPEAHAKAKAGTLPRREARRQEAKRHLAEMKARVGDTGKPRPQRYSLLTMWLRAGSAHLSEFKQFRPLRADAAKCGVELREDHIAETKQLLAMFDEPVDDSSGAISDADYEMVEDEPVAPKEPAVVKEKAPPPDGRTVYAFSDRGLAAMAEDNARDEGPVELSNLSKAERVAELRAWTQTKDLDWLDKHAVGLKGGRAQIEAFRSGKAGSYHLHDALQTVREDAAGYD